MGKNFIDAVDAPAWGGKLLDLLAAVSGAQLDQNHLLGPSLIATVFRISADAAYPRFILHPRVSFLGRTGSENATPGVRLFRSGTNAAAQNRALV